MKARYVKHKGRQAEHDVNAKLQTWWRQVEPAAVFMRTPRSGGWGNAAATGMKTRGDLCYDPSTCSLWPFSVETKHHKTVNMEAVWRFEAGKARASINKFWNQCVKAADLDGVAPLLVFRGNNMEFRVAYLTQFGDRVVRLLSSFLTYPPRHFLSYKPDLTPWLAKCPPLKSKKKNSTGS